MIILGCKDIPSREIVEVKSIEEIKSTPSNSLLMTTYNKNIFEFAKYCKKNSLDFGVVVSSLLEVIYCANIGASFIFVDDKELTKKAQKLACEYLFDAKIVAFIDHEDEIVPLAKKGVDGVIFRNFSKE